MILTVFVAILSLLLLWFINSQSSIVPILLIVMVSFVLIYDLSRVKRRISIVIAGGYVFRVFFLFWDVYFSNIFALPGSGADSKVFYSLGRRFAQGETIEFEKNFVSVVGTLLKFTGENRLYAQFILMLFSILAIFYMYKTMELMNVGEDAEVRALIFACFLPNFASLSSIFLRESIIFFSVSASVYHFTKWFKSSGLSNLLKSMLFCIIACLMHGGCVALIAGYLIVMFLYDRNAQTYRITAGNTIICIVAFAVFLFVFNNYGDTLFGKVRNVESLSDIGSTYDEGGSSYAKYVGDTTSIGRMLMFTVPRLAFFLFSPMPWMVRGINDIIAILFSSLFYLVVIVKSVKNIKCYTDPKRKNYVIALLIICLAVAFVFSMGTTNAGTALRHRDKVIALYIVLISLYKDESSYSLERIED